MTTENSSSVTKLFNIASYALLIMMVAQVCDLQLGGFELVSYQRHGSIKAAVVV
ncbi:Thymidylate synthase [hydrothermal vent metagenome]|uniref:Thymidylate synthase n=1 Tax=hydrothermal vent metagenome TaxID=652676 RepID=A0A3B1AB99_9ZZZZ